MEKGEISLMELRGKVAEIRLYSLSDANVNLESLYKAGIDKDLVSNLEPVREIDEVLRGLIRTQRMPLEERKSYAKQAYIKICDILNIPY